MSLQDAQTAVVTALNATALLSSTAEEAFTPEFDLKNMEGEKVVVAPINVENQKRMNRENKWEELPRIDIGIGQRASTIPEIKARLAVAEAVREYFKSNSTLIGTSNQYVVLSVMYTPYFDYVTLDEDHMVLSIVSISFKEFTG